MDMRFFMKVWLFTVFAVLMVTGVQGMAIPEDTHTSGVLDWSTATWSPGSMSNTYTVGDTSLSVSVSDYGSLSVPSGYPSITSGGPGGVDHALNLPMDCADSATGFRTIELTASWHIQDVFFTLTDIDTGGEPSWWEGRAPYWQDIVVVSAFEAGEERQVSYSAVGSTVGVDTNGNAYSTGSNLSLYGSDGNVPDDYSSGNVTVTISGPVDRIVIGYYPGRNDDYLPYHSWDDPNLQRIGLHDVSFSHAPEPSSCLLLLLASALAVGGRRRR